MIVGRTKAAKLLTRILLLCQPFGAEEGEYQDDEDQDEGMTIALVDAILIVRKPNSGTESIDFDVDEKEYNESIDQILKVPFVTEWFESECKKSKNYQRDATWLPYADKYFKDHFNRLKKNYMRKETAHLKLWIKEQLRRDSGVVVNWDLVVYPYHVLDKGTMQQIYNQSIKSLKEECVSCIQWASHACPFHLCAHCCKGCERHDTNGNRKRRKFE